MAARKHYNPKLDDLPTVSIIIPTRNEERYIDLCLSSIVMQDYPKEKIEIVIVDGKSTDRTLEIAKAYSACANMRFIENPEITKPRGVNKAIRASTGDRVMIADGHAEYPYDYVREIVSAAEAAGSENAGAEVLPVARNKGLLADAILKTKWSAFNILQNDKETTPYGLNLGIRRSWGDRIVIMGSHARYPSNYISTLVKASTETGAENVGGKVEHIPDRPGVIGLGVSRVKQDRLGSASDFRTEDKPEPKYSDTVFGGCYKREVFDKIGLFNPNLRFTSDLEFNRRLARAGGKILLVPTTKALYYQRTDLRAFLKKNREDGAWVVIPFLYAKSPVSLRHLIPLAFFLTLPISWVPYAPVVLMRSFQISLTAKDIRLFFVLPWMFFAHHVSYGLGSLGGLIKLIKGVFSG